LTSQHDNLKFCYYWTTHCSYYLHREDENGCVSGAAFVPEGVWPEEYTLLFGDYVFHEVYSLMEDPEHECRECAPPVSRFRNSTFYESIRYPGDSKNQAKIVDIFFGPYKDTQALYIVRFGIYDTVIRIRYTGIDNSPPLVVFSFDESKKYDVGDEVSFDGSKSTDPEGKTLVFKWFFGDGTESNEVSPIHVYAQPGEYTVTLFVEDDLKQVQQISKTVAVGDPPVVTIISPAENDQFSVGQVLTVVGEAYHANGTAFKESQLLWEVRKHHDVSGLQSKAQ
jgi:PKD repeat protein